jgi:bacillithiol system protein YtxJ
MRWKLYHYEQGADVMNTVELNSISQLEEVLAGSVEAPVFIFKHSTRCPISHAAHDEYMGFVELLDDNSAVCMDLDLLQHRDISAAIEELTCIVHQSPQVILVVAGEVKWSATHNMITVDSLRDAYSNI